MDIQLGKVISHLMHMGFAYVLALPIGWQQEKEARSAGLRTFPLVAMASCGYMLIGLYVLDGAEPQARIFYGIIGGIGFIGGGSILKNDSQVTGTANAASIWNTGAIGIAVAWNPLRNRFGVVHSQCSDIIHSFKSKKTA